MDEKKENMDIIGCKRMILCFLIAVVILHENEQQIYFKHRYPIENTHLGKMLVP